MAFFLVPVRAAAATVNTDAIPIAAVAAAAAASSKQRGVHFDGGTPLGEDCAVVVANPVTDLLFVVVETEEEVNHGCGEKA